MVDYVDKPIIPISDKIRELEIEHLTLIALKNDDFKQLNPDDQLRLISEIENGCYYETEKFCLSNNSFDQKIVLIKYDFIISRVKQFIDESSSFYVDIVLNGCINYLKKINNNNGNNKNSDNDNSEQCINPYYLSCIEERQINNNKFKELMDIIEQRNNVKIQVRTTKLYRCPVCKQNNAYYEMKQDRAGDEATSTYLWCQTPTCGNSWRIN